MSILAGDQVAEGQYFSYPGRKLPLLAAEYLEEVDGGWPVVPNAIAWLGCEIDRQLDAGLDHDLFLARVVAVGEGRLKEPPLLYSPGSAGGSTGDKAREPGTSIRDELLERLADLGIDDAGERRRWKLDRRVKYGRRPCRRPPSTRPTSSSLCEQLLAELDPKPTPAEEFLGRQYDLGLAWVHFPEGYGGLGGVAEAAEADQRDASSPPARPSPAVRNVIGYGMGAPTVVTHGSEEQKQRYLRPLFTGEEIWCQLFSEPGAGSDVAGLAARAVKDGDEWIVNGQKVWTTLAHVARWGMLVARTDPDAPKHKGMTYFVVDMHAPGVEVKPLFQITGEAEFNEVFFTDVRIPDAERLSRGRRRLAGRAHDAHERAGRHRRRHRRPAAAASSARRVKVWKKLGHDDPAKRDQLMKLWVDAEVLRLTNIRASQLRAGRQPRPRGLDRQDRRRPSSTRRSPSSPSSLLGAEGMLKPDGYPMERPRHAMLWANPQQAFLRARANSIEGGTTEIAKNILGERVLGLPGDVRVDKDVAWKDVPR